MSTTIIKVDTEAIAGASKKIDSLKVQYSSSYENVYEIFEQLDSSWNGVDNDKYREQLNEFRNDFQDLEEKLQNYIDFLNKAVTKYSDVQEDLTTKAGSLKADR